MSEEAFREIVVGDYVLLPRYGKNAVGKVVALHEVEFDDFDHMCGKQDYTRAIVRVYRHGGAFNWTGNVKQLTKLVPKNPAEYKKMFGSGIGGVFW